MSTPGKVVAIVPVRGGSRGIPRKNARLLAGKPLMAYVIEAARAAEEVDEIYVSTDDEELAEIARRYGATPLPRPSSLADDRATLDEVVAHAVAALPHAADWVVTLQATCPLLRSATIDHVIRKAREENADTALTVVDDRHLAWGPDGSGRLAPVYSARVNRQQLPPRFKETGGVVACRAEMLERGTRFGSHVVAVTVDKSEALDIDDYFDWWLVEKSLQRQSVCFHVIGSREIGLGHAYRALTLADRMIDHSVSFLINTENALASQLVRGRHYPVVEVAPGEELATLRELGPDLLINDILDTGEDYMKAVRDGGLTSVNFEDLGPGSALADLVINEMYGMAGASGGDAGEPGNRYSGVAYCVLRDEFYSVEPIEVREQVQNVLVLFGGTDPNDLTSRCLGWLGEIEGAFRITVVLGLGYPHADAVKEQAAALAHETEVVVNTGVISRYMATADLAITSAGRTVFELASLGVPMVVIPQNDRECEHTFARESPGVVALPRASELTKQPFVSAVSELVRGPLLRSAMHRSLLSMDIRGGITRTANLLNQALAKRKASTQ